MTIAEKSTELGIDLAQIALDKNPILTCTEGGVFHCYNAGGINKNIYIEDDNNEVISEWDISFRYSTTEFTEETPLATIQADFKSYINGLEFIPLTPKEELTPKE